MNSCQWFLCSWYVLSQRSYASISYTIVGCLSFDKKRNCADIGLVLVAVNLFGMNVLPVYVTMCCPAQRKSYDTPPQEIHLHRKL